MKVIVTGGAGFIGSNLVDELIEKDNEVIVIDNLSKGKRENINPKAKFFGTDIRDKDALFKIFKDEGSIGCVFHLAAQASVIKSVKDPNFDMSVNCAGTLNILTAMRRTESCEKIIYSSTGGAMCGEPDYLPIDESHPIAPVSPYGVSKYIAELYIELYHRLYGIKFANLRYANVYGPRQDPFGEGGVVAIFSNKLLNNERPTIYSDGEQTRDFVYVSDIINANLRAMEKEPDDSFMIGTGKETSVNEIFRLIKELSKKNDIKPIYMEKRKGEIRNCSLNSRKIKDKLFWEPKVSIEEGLKKTLEYFLKKK